MATENIPTKDALYGQWVTNFATVATANATLLNLTSGQITTFNAQATAFETAYAESQAAKVTAKAKVGEKDSVRRTSEVIFRQAAKMIGANADVKDELKGDLGLKTNPTPVSPINPPTDLSATGYANGGNLLKWKRNGNSKTSTFLIEARIGSSINWTFVAVTTKTTFTHAGQTPGQQITYRVITQRAATQSLPSNLAVVYGPESSEVFTLKEAA